ncbi:MAG: hypothetical protein HFH57_13690 [Lachnospiraceae bacterium]|nr:hypothetical protein [Lachnospiraceae bacterium]
MKPRVKISTQLSGQDFRIVKNNGVLDKDAPLLFTFSNFKMSPINIDGVFNNYFGDETEYIRKVTILFEKALPLLSNEKYSLFNDPSKTEALHLHQLHGKEDILQKIFTAYHFGEQAINNFIEGAEIYQLEVPYENGATRIVFERIDNLISFLFLDPNHHIYMNRKYVEQNHSLFYDFCPVNLKGNCQRMDYLGTCFAFEFLDEQKYNNTYNYKYEPNITE